MKKLFSCFLTFIMIFGLFVPCASALFDSGAVTSHLRSDIYYLESLDEGTVLFEKESNKKTPAAGFVKILAAIAAIEKWGNLDGSIKLTQANLNVFEYEYGMTTAIYEVGETVSKRELFDCLVVYSANDALSVIAYEVSGSLQAFLAEIQALVQKIGCTSTVIKNIHGFDEDGQYTTAADVAKIIKYATQYPAFNEAFSAAEITLKETSQNEERTYKSSNKMKNAAIDDYYHSSVTGGKQTSTEDAGECIAVISNKDGYSYLTVVMGGQLTDIDNDYYDENTSMTDTKLMLDWVYSNIRYKVVASADQTIANIDVEAGQGNGKLRLIPEKETSALVPAKVTPASVMFEVVDKPESVVAPVRSGDVIAKANIYYAGQKLTSVNLIAADDVKLSFGGVASSVFKSIAGSKIFLVFTLVLALISLLRFVLDLKDFIVMKKKKNYEPMPASFDVLMEKIGKVFSFKGKKKKKSKKSKRPVKKNPAASKKGAPQRKPAPGKKPVPSQRRNPGAKPVAKRPDGKPVTAKKSDNKQTVAAGKTNSK